MEESALFVSIWNILITKPTADRYCRYYCYCRWW